MENTPAQETASRTVRQNITAIANLEASLHRQRTRSERFADSIAEFAGTMAFVVVHAVVYGFWILANLVNLPGIRHFDPYPFMLLSVVVSLEAIFLAAFILINENRMSQQSDQRAHLDLQINLLAEREMTLVLQMLQRISTRLGISHSSEELQELSTETSVEALAKELQDVIDPPAEEAEEPRP